MVNKIERKKFRFSGLLWCIIIFGGGLVFVFDIFSQSHPIMIQSNNVMKLINKISNKKYVVDTEGCRIQYFEAKSSEITQYIRKPDIIICNNGTPPLVDSNVTSIFILNSSMGLYGAEDFDDMNCCYTPFWSNFSNDITYSDKCIYFKESVDIKDEFIRVNCTIQSKVNGTNFYTDYFSFAILKGQHEKKSPMNKSDTYIPMNVLVLGLDAVSRLNFHRQLPLTISYMLKNLSAVELMGYNKVEDNTFPNLIPVLSGVTDTELALKCWPTYQTAFDNCSFLWNSYKEAGFLTAFGEDAAWMGLFHYQKRGFYQHPTDYYWRTFSAEAERKLGNEHHFNCKVCVGGRPTYTLLWNYICKFVKVLKDHPYFGFFWETELSHDFLNSPALADEMYFNSLHELHASGYLDNTVIVIMSDHGIRWGGIRYTTQGSYEDRLPGVFISLPESYRKQFPHIYDNLQRNAKLLTTPFDLHETFLDLINPFKLTNQFIEARNFDYLNVINKTSYSLFDYIPKNRTCGMAKIPMHWCTCQNSVEINKDDKQVYLAVNFIIKYMNKQLLEHTNCATLCLDKIYQANVQLVFHDKKIEHAQFDTYKIIFSVKPGDGIFEGTVKKYFRQNNTYRYNLEGGLSRLNVYGNQSHCVVDIHLKIFCYCL